MISPIGYTLPVVWLTATFASAATPVDFDRDIRSILNRHCVACHGGVKQASGLSFVYQERVFGQGRSGRTIVVPGDPQGSELIRRITATDDSVRMPPVDELPDGLTRQETEVLTRWVEEGAAWSGHWALAPPRPAPYPLVKNADWCRRAFGFSTLGGVRRIEVLW